MTMLVLGMTLSFFMKKTLIITLEYPPQIGGIASYVYNLAAHLPVEQAVICAPKIKGDTEFDQKNSWKTYRARPLFLLFWPRWFRLLWHAWRICKKEKIEQVYIHHALPVGYIGLFLLKIMKLPYTIFLHGSDLFWARKNWWKKRQFRRVCGRAQTIVVNSEYMRHEIGNTVENLSDVRVVYPCAADVFLQPVDHTKVEQVRAQFSLSGKRVMITASRLVDRKGHAILASVFAEILKRVPNAVWLIIGDGPEKNNVIKILQKNNLTGVVRFLPAVPLLELPIYFAAADLFVLLTHTDRDGVNEAWGQAFLEAAAMYLPTVAGVCGGAAEAVENGVTGMVIEATNTTAVVNTISDLLQNIDYARGLGKAGHERVSREFTWDNQIKKLE